MAQKMTFPPAAALLLNYRAALFFTALVFLFSRMAILLTNSEGVSNLEELYRGALAQEFIDGLKFPVFEYQADSYSGGSLVIGFLASFFFRFLGPSLFALKLTSLICFSFTSWVLSVFFMRRYFGRNEALLAGALYALAPPSLTANSLFGMGYHSDSIIFSVLIYIGIYEYQWKGRKPRWLLFAAVVGGFGTWFINTVFLSFAACVAGCAFQRKNFWPLKDCLILASGFVIGGAPWIIYNSIHPGYGIDFLSFLFWSSASGEPSVIHFLLAVLKRGILLGVYSMPAAFGYPDLFKIPGILLGYSHYALFIYLAASTLQADRLEPRTRPFLAYLGLFFLVYTLGRGIPLPGYKAFSEFRYFSPLFWILTLSVSAWIFSHPKRRLLIAIFLTFGLFAVASLIGKERGEVFRYKGYSYFRLGDARDDLWKIVPAEWAAQLRFFKQFPEPHGHYLFWGLSQQYPFKGEKFDPAEIRTRLNDLSERERGYWLGGLGFYLGNHANLEDFLKIYEALKPSERKYLAAAGYSMALPDRVDPFKSYLMNIERVPQEVRSYFYFAAGMMAYNPEDQVWFLPDRRLLEVPETFRAWVYRGIGAGFSGYWIWDPLHYSEECRNLLVRIPEAYRKDFYWGLGWGIRREIPEDRLRARNWISRLPAAARTQAAEGMTAFEDYFGARE